MVHKLGEHGFIREVEGGRGPWWTNARGRIPLASAWDEKVICLGKENHLVH